MPGANRARNLRRVVNSKAIPAQTEPKRHRFRVWLPTVPQTCHMMALPVMDTDCSDANEIQQPDETDRWGWTVAVVGMRCGAIRTGRPAPLHQFVAAPPCDGGPDCACPRPGGFYRFQGATCGGGARQRDSAGPGLGGRNACRQRHVVCSVRQLADFSDGQERSGTSGPARRPNKRGDAPARQAMAVPRRQMHPRHPALSGCRDQAVRNSCLQGEER